jgi:signal peptidase I
MKEKRQKKTALPTIDQIETERKRYRWKKAYFKALRGTISVLTYMAAVAALIATLVLPVLQIEGTSMEPTLVNGDIVLLTKTTAFGRGDICGFAWNNKILIKRVIGIPGDWIEIDTDGTVYLNGEKLDEPYAEQIAFGECDLEFPFQVPQEQYFVLGDMRESSIDSRNTLVGCVENEQIIGKIFFRIWPLKDIRFFNETVY